MRSPHRPLVLSVGRSLLDLFGELVSASSPATKLCLVLAAQLLFGWLGSLPTPSCITLHLIVAGERLD